MRYHKKNLALARLTFKLKKLAPFTTTWVSLPKFLTIDAKLNDWSVEDDEPIEYKEGTHLKL